MGESKKETKPPAAPTWHPLLASLLPDLARVASQIHPALPERPSVFAERIHLFPSGCLALLPPSSDSDSDPDSPLSGYAISHPIRRRHPPALDTLLGGEIVSDADQFYIHDVAVLPDARGMGRAREGVERLLEVAREGGFETTGLVAVYGTEGFWERFGFVRVQGGEELREKLRGYGEDAVFLERRNGG